MSYALVILGYLFGSISSAVIVSRAFGLADPRTVGSGNPGATNILRQGRKTAAVLTLLGDLLKGVVPVVIARAFSDDPLLLALVAGAAFLGHLYPVFFDFRGGKGVATALGIYFALAPWVGLVLVITWITVALVSRYSSLAALVAAILSPFYTWWLLPGLPYLVMSVMVAALLLWRHRGNIERLLKGEEDKIKFGKS